MDTIKASCSDTAIGKGSQRTTLQLRTAFSAPACRGVLACTRATIESSINKQARVAGPVGKFRGNGVS
jgi:hypothetical protein